MKNFFFKNHTVVSVLSIIFILLGIPLGLFLVFLQGNAYAGIGGAFIIFGVFAAIVLFVIDRFLVQFIPLLQLNIGELVLIFLLISNFEFNERRLHVHVDPDISYFFIFENNGTLKNTASSRLLPFDKRIKVKNHHIIVPSLEKINRVQVHSPQNWDSHSRSTRYTELKFTYYINSNFPYFFTSNVIDSLANIELEAILNTSSIE